MLQRAEGLARLPRLKAGLRTSDSEVGSPNADTAEGKSITRPRMGAAACLQGRYRVNPSQHRGRQSCGIVGIGEQS